MGKYLKSERELLEEATGWLLRLESSEENSQLRADFENWLAASFENRAAWEKASKTWQLLGAAKPVDGDEPGQVVVLPEATSRERTSRSVSSTTSGRAGYGRRAIGVVAALAAIWIIWIATPALLVALQADHITATGQLERVRMADGSIVDLGGRSAISTDISTLQRRVRLLAGEAFFDIAPDASRPFVVDVRGIEVKVLGTAFDAQVTSTRTEVALLRGSIEALPGKDGKPSLLMKPGDMLAVEHATGAVTIGKVSTEDIGAWREGKVFIADATVASVVELIQRYHPAWLSLPDRSLASRKVSGLFDLRNPDHALSALVEPFGGKVRSVTPWGRVISRL